MLAKEPRSILQPSSRGTISCLRSRTRSRFTRLPLEIPAGLTPQPEFPRFFFLFFLSFFLSFLPSSHFLDLTFLSKKQLGDEEFRRLYLDVMNEVDRRVTGEGDAAAPGGQKLAKLEQADFTALASTVFEEQNQREYFNVYSSHPAPNSDGEDTLHILSLPSFHHFSRFPLVD